MNIPCEIVEDLLPLYTDNVCTDQSRRAVAEHLSECEKCQKLIKSTQAVAIPQIEPEQPISDNAIKKGLRKIRYRWWASVLIILALFPVALLGWNEYSAQGVAYSNQNELACGNAFMTSLMVGDYEKAYTYLDIEAKKHQWLTDWFEEEDLVNMETDGLEKFCELGANVEALGGIESFEYVGVHNAFAVDYRGNKVHQIIYKIKFEGKPQEFRVDVSSEGVKNFSGAGSFLTDPLAKLGAWGEYLWQDYKGCYFDPELHDYVYYDK